MHLTLRKRQRLMNHYVGELTKQCKAKGLKLNYPKAIALITSELLEIACDGLSITELMQKGKHILTANDVMGISIESLLW